MAKAHKNKRLARRFGKKDNTKSIFQVLEPEVASHSHKNEKKSFYNKYYKQLMIIPFLMLFLAFVALGFQYVDTGSFVNKGISLTGGTSITLTADMTDLSTIDTTQLENNLRKAFPNADVSTRLQRQISEIVAIEIETDISAETEAGEIELQAFKEELVTLIGGITMDDVGQNVRSSGSALGASFFKQIIFAMIAAFVLMGIVIFIQFKVPIPSFAVILAAFSDIVVTLAIVNLLGMKLSTAGIAAFLMLIGYSVDTDVLLSTRVLKNKEGSVYERVISALKTGLTMNITTLVAVSVALIFSESQVISQIMTIIFIGLLVDMINTWFQNAGILRIYTEKKERENK